MEQLSSVLMGLIRQLSWLIRLEDKVLNQFCVTERQGHRLIGWHLDSYNAMVEILVVLVTVFSIPSGDCGAVTGVVTGLPSLHLFVCLFPLHHPLLSSPPPTPLTSQPSNIINWFGH